METLQILIKYFGDVGTWLSTSMSVCRFSACDSSCHHSPLHQHNASAYPLNAARKIFDRPGHWENH